MPVALEIREVVDHGVWRGHRTWEVNCDTPDGGLTVNVVDVETEARKQALKQVADYKPPTAAEREAHERNRRSLERSLR